MSDDQNRSAKDDETFTFVDKRRVTPDGSEESAGSDPAPETPADERPQAIASEPGAEDAGGEEPGSGPSDDTPPTEAMVQFAINLFVTDAFQRMGLVADPSTGKAKADLAQARLAIDCVAALVGVIDTPERALPDDARREIRRILNDLRLNFLEQSKRT